MSSPALLQQDALLPEQGRDSGGVLNIPLSGGPRAVEDVAFPFEEISEIAERESWRKELNRPLCHIQKWWAHRLGSVFRAIAIGSFAPSGSDLMELFHSPVRVPGAAVFDPFMGSGTTVGEALKIGCRAIGRDINPVSHLLVDTAIRRHDRQAIVAEFRSIERDLADRLLSWYRVGGCGESVVLCYFWVAQAGCPGCGSDVDLFSTYVFARHSRPEARPLAHAVCPGCGAVNRVRHDCREFGCAACGRTASNDSAPARRLRATCPECAESFRIVDAVRDSGRPPGHRMYAKLVLRPDGKKEYLGIGGDDLALYAAAGRELSGLGGAHPEETIRPGHNTNQVLRYNYRAWNEMFNARQLLCLSLLAGRIREIRDEPVRRVMTCLFSGALEFNNMFASYKGEGTGAVRHMFSHHILKPERTPIEANPWGANGSSGSFSALFRSRILRALDYAEDPFELAAPGSNGGKPGAKVRGLSEPIGCDVAGSRAEMEGGCRAYVSCGDSSATDLADGSVDAVITDPPFFDNVHYSELADFFHVWQRHVLDGPGAGSPGSTRSDREVQAKDAATFTARLGGVFREANRVLRDEGIMVFTYHHSRREGWASVLAALAGAGFWISAAHPVKAEMSFGVPKRGAKEPIDIDVIIACRKRPAPAAPLRPEGAIAAAAGVADGQVRRLRARGRSLSRNDVRVILMAQLIRFLSAEADPAAAAAWLEEADGEIEKQISRLHRRFAPPGNGASGRKTK